MGWGPRGCVPIRGSWWDSYDSLKGGPGREMGWAVFCPLRWAEQRLGRPPTPPRGLWTSLCLERCLCPLFLCCHQPCLLGLLPCFGLFQLQNLGESRGPMSFLRASCCLYIFPPLGSWERLGGGAASWGHSSPESRPRHPEAGVPWAVVTQKVCARVCKCGCVCVRVFCLSL